MTRMKVLGFEFTIRDRQAKAKIASFSQDFKHLARSAKRSMQDTSRAVKRTSAVVTGMAVAATRELFKFQDAMTSVRTLMLDMSAKDFAKIENDVRSLSKEFGRSTQAIASGLFEVVSAGDDVAKRMERMRQIMPLVIAGGAEMGDATKLVGTIVNAYGGEWERTGEIVDKVFQTNKLGVTTVAALAQSMGGVVNLASTMGLSLDDLFGSMASLTKGSKNTRVSVTNLQALLQSLAKPTKELAALFEQTAHGTAEAALKNIGFQETLKIVADATGGNVGELTKLLGSIQSVNAALNLTGPNAQRTTDAINAMGFASGEGSKAITEAMKSDAEQMRRFWANVSDLGIIVAKGFNGSLSSIISQLQEAAPQIQEAARQFGQLISTVLEFAKANPELSKFLAILAVGQILGINTALLSLAGTFKSLIVLVLRNTVVANGLTASWGALKTAALASAGGVGGLTRSLAAARLASLALKGGLIALALYGIAKVAEWTYKSQEAIQEYKTSVREAMSLDDAWMRKKEGLNNAFLKQTKSMATSSVQLTTLKAKLKDAERSVSDYTGHTKAANREFDRLNGTWNRWTGNKHLENAKNDMSAYNEKLHEAQMWVRKLKNEIAGLENPQAATEEAVGKTSISVDAEVATGGFSTPGDTTKEDKQAKAIADAIAQSQAAAAERKTAGFGQANDFLKMGPSGAQLKEFLATLEGATPEIVAKYAAAYQRLQDYGNASQENIDKLSTSIAESLNTSVEDQEKAKEKSDALKKGMTSFIDKMKEMREQYVFNEHEEAMFIKRAKALRDALKDGSKSVDEFTDGMNGLTNAVDAAADAKAEDDADDLAVGQQIAAQVGQAVGSSIAPSFQSMRQMMQQQMNQARQWAQQQAAAARANAPRIIQANGALAMYLSSMQGQIALLRNNIALLEQALPFKKGSSRLEAERTLEEWYRQLTQMSSYRPPILVPTPATGPSNLTDDPGLEASEGSGGVARANVVVNMPDVTNMDSSQIRPLALMIIRELQLLGKQQI